MAKKQAEQEAAAPSLADVIEEVKAEQEAAAQHPSIKEITRQIYQDKVGHLYYLRVVSNGYFELVPLPESVKTPGDLPVYEP